MYMKLMRQTDRQTDADRQYVWATNIPCLERTCTSSIKRKCRAEVLDCAFQHLEVLLLQLCQNFLTTIHAMKKIVPFCLVQDGESTDMNCSVFWEYCENGKILMKCQVYNKGIFFNFGYFFML